MVSINNESHFKQEEKRVVLYWALSKGVSDENTLVDYCDLTLETVRKHIQNFETGGNHHRDHRDHNQGVG